jgi:hypothetical protein
MTSWGFKMTTRSSIMVSGTTIFVLKSAQPVAIRACEVSMSYLLGFIEVV